MMKENSSSGRVFGRQKGKKLSKRQSGNFERYLPIFSIFPTKKDGSYDFTSESLHKIFRTKSHVELELGFGMGDFLVEKAKSQPEVGFLGCEVYENGVSSLISKILENKISNLLIFHGNCTDLLENLRGANLHAVYLLFPDPWPKTKHRKRRFLCNENIEKIASVLSKRGIFFMGTDVEDYAEQILDNMDKSKNFRLRTELVCKLKFPMGVNFMTKYEKKAVLEGRRTHFMAFERLYHG